MNRFWMLGVFGGGLWLSSFQRREVGCGKSWPAGAPLKGMGVWAAVCYREDTRFAGYGPGDLAFREPYQMGRVIGTMNAL
jgi:hypothetical protein